MSVDATDTTHERPPTDHPHEKPTGADEEAFGPDDVFHLLQNQRRRRVLRCLRDADGTLAMSDVAEQVAAWEHDTTVDALTSTQRQRVYIALYQRHLPKLDDMDVVDYNQSRGLVTPRPRADRVIEYLDLATDDGTVVDRTAPAPGPADGPADDDRTPGDRWPTYFLGASTVGAVLLAGTALGVPVLASLPALGVAAALVVTFLLLSVAQLRA